MRLMHRTFFNALNRIMASGRSSVFIVDLRRRCREGRTVYLVQLVGVKSIDERIDAPEFEQLTDIVKMGRWYRLNRFNSQDGVVLRLFVSKHTSSQMKRLEHCAFCGINAVSKQRGYRKVTACGKCYLHLCINANEGNRRCYFDVRHSTRVLFERRID